ncbi:dehydrogenase FPY6 isoform X1 [Cryptomeria japonica]|uniref:dehydrogenase FPY6 isoform X1 n=1 Tax=Cryptomeria japonica TaxID=3369 RepID=UPI0025AD5DF6|nr:dehydrogenase FPY6 isoform X1 [Cryptomeria japonica]XP_057819009.1 dehydrogenase FPY6 isoform X1 [Cryptomeria japonica]XP_057819010.1 dehydrogenase FPY6 isoform X1 [Cryptomeria japonica]
MEQGKLEVPQLALLGGGIFVQTQYIPRLREIAHLVSLKVLWSRSEKSAKVAAALALDFSPNIDIKWGEAGLNEIIQDKSIHGVAVVLAGQAQVEISTMMLKAGKHVLQEKPAALSVTAAVAALSFYTSLSINGVQPPIWAIAENYRFEPALLEAAALVKDLGDLMTIQFTAEAPMNNLNPYFSSEWRRNFIGGFILDVGVHFIAGLRLVAGCEIISVAAISRHVDPSLPPPDNISSLFQLDNGCAGVFSISLSSTSRKICLRVVGSKGTVEVGRGTKDGGHGYTVAYYPAGGVPQHSFYPFSGVNNELKAFVNDMFKAASKEGPSSPDSRSSLLEGARDVAVIEAMLQSSAKQGALVHVEQLS